MSEVVIPTIYGRMKKMMESQKPRLFRLLWYVDLREQLLSFLSFILQWFNEGFVLQHIQREFCKWNILLGLTQVITYVLY